jgi:hypothetical protein
MSRRRRNSSRAVAPSHISRQSLCRGVDGQRESVQLIGGFGLALGHLARGRQELRSGGIDGPRSFVKFEAAEGKLWHRPCSWSSVTRVTKFLESTLPRW